MLPEELDQALRDMIAHTDQPREMAVDVLYALQNHFGYLCDEAIEEAAKYLGMSALEVDGLATFYDFLYREPVGRYVIHVCDGVVCWMHRVDGVFRHLQDVLGIAVGETTPDGMFSILPTACIGDCQNAPGMLVNGKYYGRLTNEKIDDILARLREHGEEIVVCR
jgi:NADH-quinone oxidoreductase subunit E